jgi:hypothetical protein
MTTIHFGLGDGDIHGCMMHMDMVLDRFDPENKERCIFKEKTRTTGAAGTTDPEDCEFREKENRVIAARWREKWVLYFGGTLNDRGEKGGRFDIPPYPLRIEREVLDSKLPGIRADAERNEISFEWRGMFSCFYREWGEVGRRMRAWQRYMGIKWTSTYVDEGKFVDGGWSLFKQVILRQREVIRQVRRVRIKKFYRR